MRYREDQRDLKRVFYTDPSDLFLNGVMDTRRGTCGNIAMLHVALAWRLGWPVSLACAGSHHFCRYDDGTVTHNLETTNYGRSGFNSPTDDYYQKAHQLPERARHCGSDLRMVTPREFVGIFFGFRARHFDNTNREFESERDYLAARFLFPQNRALQISQVQNAVQYGIRLFEPHEKGHPIELFQWLRDVVTIAPWKKRNSPHKPGKPRRHEHVDSYFISNAAPSRYSIQSRIVGQ